MSEEVNHTPNDWLNIEWRGVDSVQSKHAGLGADLQDTINRRVYHSAGVDRLYANLTLNRAEAVALLKYQATFAGQDVLDIGVGTGRTTIYLAPLARRYEAIDYSPVMVARARENFPQISVRLGDMRDLSDFDDASFDFVFGSNCVLDAVSHSDRVKALCEMRRVLRPGGTLIFSSHNRQLSADLRAPRMQWSRNPVNSAVNFVRYLRQVSNRASLAAACHEEEEFALFSDEGHDHACLHYYIDHAHQRRQLMGLGLQTVDVLDHQGHHLHEGDAAPGSGWLIYAAVAQGASLALTQTSVP